jgi:hypothetical protein
MLDARCSMQQRHCFSSVLVKGRVGEMARYGKTGSSLPLAGLGGIALLILAIGIGIYRRF